MHKICKKNNLTTVITRSSDGANLVTRKEVIHMKAELVPEEYIVDTTGIGSIFMSSFLHLYVNGYHVNKCTEIANAAAAKGLKILGSRINLDIEEIMDSNLNTVMRN